MKDSNEKDLNIKKLLEKNNVKTLVDLDILIGKMKKNFIEATLNAEFDEHIGYNKHDQNSREVSNNYRKGKTQKTISTSNGKVTINVPRDHNSTFEPKIVKKHQRNIQQIEDQILFLYSKGMSTRDIQETLYQMFYCDLDKDTISRITDRILPEIVAWQQRPLDSIYPIVYVDGIRFKVREESLYVEKSVYIIIGINIDGYKEILGFWIAESESARQWLNIFNELKSRGIQDILLACCDNLKGISESFKAVFPDVNIQKCVIHQIRNCTRHVASTDLQNFVSDMKKIYKANSYKEALVAFDNFAQKWESKYTYAIKSWKNNFNELTTFFDFPNEIRKIIYTTNTIENVNRNIRSITKTKGGFTNTNSLMKIIYLKLIDIENKWKARTIGNWPLIINQLRILFPNKIMI